MLQKYPRVGKYIGGGCSKACYELDDKKVALVADDYIIRSEVQFLAKLKKLDIPVLEVKVQKVVDEKGDIVRALIARRYDNHTFDFRGVKLNRFHKAKLRKILRGFRKHKLDCPDLQFLYSEDGDLVVCDPGGVILRKKGEYNYSLKTLNKIVNRLR